MPSELDANKTGYYIAQFLYGIIPFEFWKSSLEESRDPFEGMSEKEKRIAKRKYRKLKRKVFGDWKASRKKGNWRMYSIKKYVHDGGKIAWFNSYLMREQDDE